MGLSSGSLELISVDVCVEHARHVCSIADVAELLHVAIEYCLLLIQAAHLSMHISVDLAVEVVNCALSVLRSTEASTDKADDGSDLTGGAHVL